MNRLAQYFSSSIGKKQTVAVTGFLIILFVTVHLLENLLIYAGADVFNAYVKWLVGLRPGLYVVEAGLAAVFLIHIFFTAWIVWENYSARSIRYAQFKTGNERSWAARLMPYTGTILFAFILWHLLDFTFADKHGPRSFLNGESQYIYGVVVNSFKDPFHSALYILAMASLGFHIAHGTQSFMQTFGWNHPRYTPFIRKFSLWFGVVIAVGFSTIPLYVLMKY